MTVEARRLEGTPPIELTEVVEVAIHARPKSRRVRARHAWKLLRGSSRVVQVGITYREGGDYWQFWITGVAE